MTKKSIENKIKDIGKLLTSSKAKEALKTLREELKKLPDDERKASDFSLDLSMKRKSHGFFLFTDGACRGNPGPGSFAYMVQDSSENVIKEYAEHTEMTTNNKMELEAIVQGLSFLKSQVTPMHSVNVYTDSKYVVDGMKSWVAGWKRRGWKKADNKTPENVDQWKKLDELSNICHVSFNWVKGHAGHPQNEHVDKLANEVLDENGF